MAHTFANLLYHIVFSTKDRVPLIREDLEERLYTYIGGITRGGGRRPSFRNPHVPARRDSILTGRHISLALRAGTRAVNLEMIGSPGTRRFEKLRDLGSQRGIRLQDLP